MAKGIIPILHIKAPHIISLDIEDIMESHGVKVEDDFTYTTRYTVPNKANTNSIIADLRRRVAKKALDADEVEAFIKFMDETAWDCSFLVDTY